MRTCIHAVGGWQMGQVRPILIGGEAGFLYTARLTDSLYEDAVGLPSYDVLVVHMVHRLWLVTLITEPLGVCEYRLWSLSFR